MDHASTVSLANLIPLGEASMGVETNGRRLQTDPRQWAYSAQADLNIPGIENESRILKISLVVERGVLGVGWLRSDGSAWVVRGFASKRLEPYELKLVLPAQTPGGKLIFDNWTEGGEPAHAVIYQIQVIRNDSERRFRAALAEEEAGNPAAAIASYKSVLELEPSHINARAALGRLLVSKRSPLPADLIDFPPGDYVSPGLAKVMPDASFPHMIIGDKTKSTWPYLRREIDHNWYVDRRWPTVGFINRDEAHILYNCALRFRRRRALEIGCWAGWSACHLALAGVELDIIDPALNDVDMHASVSESLFSIGVGDRVELIPGESPEKVFELARTLQRRWSLVFIDGNHDAPHPLKDARAAHEVAENDALILFHDLISPDVAEGLNYFRDKGWNTVIYQTMQIMGAAWRGSVEPIAHAPDPRMEWTLPKHLETYRVSALG
jgi:predicted O-methyltransferase YrrM